MKNLLATHLTTWKWWYAIFGVVAFVLASNIAVLGQLFGAQEDGTSNLQSVLSLATFIVFVVLALGFIALASRRWPTREDLALKAGMTRRDLAIVGTVFVVTHAIFWVLGKISPQPEGAAATFFDQMGLGGPLLPAIVGIVSGVIMAPVCEELLYRGAVLRSIHDAFARRGAATAGAVVAILVSAVVFAMPHLAGSLVGAQAVAYLVTGVAFGLVYVLTGSMTAAMIAHALQSCVAFAQVLYFGSGDATVSPILWIIVLGCPIWVYLIARALTAVFPRGRERTLTPA